MVKSRKAASRTVLTLAAAAILAASQAALGWEPSKPVEFIATAGPGGGTDIFARTVQSIIQKHKLVSQPVVVVNKGGGSGAEGWLYVKSARTHPYPAGTGNPNTCHLPLEKKKKYKHTD